jgi:cob(I)alamin adenosyltransferase
MQKIMQRGKHDLVIMDEMNIALHYKLIQIDDLLELIRNKPDHVELVITSRYAPSEL